MFLKDCNTKRKTPDNIPEGAEHIPFIVRSPKAGTIRLFRYGYIRRFHEQIYILHKHAKDRCHYVKGFTLVKTL